MDNQDRQAIDGLFQKLDQVERQGAQRDADAEGFIRDRIARQPGAPYFMAQTIVMQDYALQQAQARIQELEQNQQQAAQQARPAQGGGFFSSMFGSGSAPAQQRSAVPQAGRSAVPGAGAQGNSPWGGQQGGPQAGQAGQPAGPWGGQAQQPARGGGFLAGAAQTAMGVAGGMLLGSAIGSMLGGGSEANAAESTPPAEPAAAPEEDYGSDDSWGDGGGEEW